MAQQKAKRDWLEPPAWWKKVKPLRWLLGAVVLLGIYSAIRALWPASEAPAVATAPATTVAEAPPPAVAVPPAETPAPGIATPVTPAPEPVIPNTVPSPPEPVPEPAKPEPAKPEPAKPAPPEPEPPKPDPTKPRTSPAEPPTAGPEAEPPRWEENAPMASDYTRVEQDRLLLADQFRSYDSVTVVQGQLTNQSFTPTVQSTHRKLHADVPPYDLDTITVEKFKHLDVEGTLTMGFFNDRLYEVEFEPSEPKKYLDALRRKTPFMRRGESGRSEYLEGHLRLASSLELAISDVGKALHTRPYVLWQDRRLVGQRDSWDYQFSKLAEH
jgi:hypothetical protein